MPSRSVPLVTDVEIGARPFEICRHPSLGGLRLLLGEFLGIDDHSVLAGEREEILHPLPADADIAGGREGDERLQQRGAVDRLVAERGNHLRQSELDELDLVGLDSPSSSAFPSWVVLETPLPMTANLRPFRSLKSRTVPARSLRMTMAAKPNPWATWPLSATSFMTMPRAKRVEQSGRDRRAADLHLAGRDRRAESGARP